MRLALDTLLGNRPDNDALRRNDLDYLSSQHYGRSERVLVRALRDLADMAQFGGGDRRQLS